MSAVLLALVTTGCTGTTTVSAPSTDLGPIAGDPTAWKRVPAKAMPLPALMEEGQQQIDASKPVLVNFWASWCSACKEEMPWLQRLSQQGDVTVVGVTRDRFTKYAAASMAKADATYPVRMDPDGTYLRNYRGLLGPGLPHSALIVDGKVRAVHIGPFRSFRELRRGATA